MAVLDNVPGLVVDILVDDEPIPEYDDEHSSSSSDTTVKYIKAETGKQFEIRYTFTHPPPNDGILCQIKIDNNDWKGNHLLDTAKNSNYVRKVIGRALSFVDSTWYGRRFQFQEITTSEDSEPNVQADEEECSTLGSIVATFYWVNGIHGFDPVGDFSTSTTIKQPNAGVSIEDDSRSHYVGFTEREVNPKPRKVRGYDKDSMNKFATFVFKYRSRDALKSLGIILDEDIDEGVDERNRAENLDFNSSVTNLVYRPKISKKLGADEEDARSMSESVMPDSNEDDVVDSSDASGAVVELAIRTRQKPLN